MRHLQTHAAHWQASLGASPSAAPQHLMEQLIGLALAKGRLSPVISELCAIRLFTRVTAEWTLSECALRGDAAGLRESLRLAREHDVGLTSTGYSALIRGAGDLADSESFFKEAA